MTLIRETICGSILSAKWAPSSRLRASANDRETRCVTLPLHAPALSGVAAARTLVLVGLLREGFFHSAACLIAHIRQYVSTYSLEA
jgi:hypothetical protein